MTTFFALEKLRIPKPYGEFFEIWFDGNSKITLGGEESFEKPIANAFSLIQIADCPFATSICKKHCYVHNLEKKEREVHEKYRLNSETIRKILANRNYTQRASIAFADYITRNCYRGFRWHVSGDIFSFEYANFIKSVCLNSLFVRHWIYTRSRAFLSPLFSIPNIVINLSADEENWQEALRMHNLFGFRLCYMTVDGSLPSDLPDGSVIFPDYDLRGRGLSNATDAPWWKQLSARERRMVCPADFFGQSPRIRCGPCKKCLK